MKLSTFLFTNPGTHTPNEDALEFFADGNLGVWALADGLGGHARGELASQYAVRTIRSLPIGEAELTNEAIEAAYQGINSYVYSQNGPRTTLVSAFLKEGVFRFANVGDSRLYYFRKGELFQRTADHSVAYAAYASGEVNYGDIRFHPDRSRLVRAIGTSEKVQPQLYPAIETEAGDAFLMCSDGFWEYLFETEMEIDLLKSRQPKDWVDFMLLRIVRRLKSESDNFSAIAVMIQ